MNTQSKQTFMSSEVETIPALTRRLLEDKEDVAASAGAYLRGLNPQVITTIARGSSDHAATYLKYVIELMLGVPVASAGPSISSVYNAPLHLQNAASIAISQSGESPDILSAVQAAKDGGSHVISFANNDASPLAQLSHQNINIGAGLEKSVAATKTFVLSIVAGLMVIAHWKQDQKLLEALNLLPTEFEAALACDWSHLTEHIAADGSRAQSLYVLGRGPSFAIAAECALKFKETCQLHAEAYSSAEVLHGPVSIARKGFTVLALASNDASRQGVVESSQRIAKQGVDVFITSSDENGQNFLPVTRTVHPITDPLAQVVTFYSFIERLSAALGLDPDKPPHLLKVTETV